MKRQLLMYKVSVDRLLLCILYYKLIIFGDIVIQQIENRLTVITSIIYLVLRV